MKAIILAAGQGSRLRPLTDDKPKCLVEYSGKAIVDYILSALRGCGIEDIIIVKGYLAERLEREGTKSCLNPKFERTNMVSTLFCAENEMDDDLIISYADIVYGERTLQKLLDAKDDFSLLIDTDWRRQWEARMDDPLVDAETLKLDSEGYVIELGKKPSSYEDIEGQYMGLIKISREVLPRVKTFYHELDKEADYEGKNFDNMYMTTFIQLVIDRLMKVKAVPIEGGWLEIDCLDDLNYEVRL